jgi:multiple sugar transport system permease protein
VLATAVPAGYGLALSRFPGRRLVLTLTLVVMIMPAATLVLPIFLELDAMNLIGSSLSVILPFAFFPFGVYLAYIYYSTALPTELLDAARIDGCGEWSTFRRIALPLAKPVVALVFFFSFVSDWNNFFLPYAVLPDSSQYPIQVGLSNLLSSTPSFNPAVGGGGQQVAIFRPELALATLLAVIPVAIVFLVSQRALVRGLVTGAVKS